MTRTLDPALETAAQQPVYRDFFAVELMFASGPSRANSTPTDITIDGNLYRGVGELGRIGPAKESTEVQADKITVGLTGIDPALISIALADHYQGRRGTIYHGLLDEDHQVVGSYVLFRGRMDVMPIEMGKTATIDVAISSRLADWSRPRGARYTDEEQQRRHPGDLGLQFVSATVERELNWGSGGTSQPVVMQAAGGGGKK